MKAICALYTDRGRRQRGSVLSGVLIMLAFIAIISGALMTELSTNFLLSNNLTNRVAIQATVNSAVESAADQLKPTSLNPLERGCPTLSSVSLNKRSAIASYAAPCLQRRVTAGPASWSSFSVDGTRVQLSGRDEYLTGDTNGVVYEYDFGKSTPNWTLPLGGSVKGQPQAMLDPTSSANILNLIPIEQPTQSATPGCGPTRECVAVLFETPPYRQFLLCYLAANGRVTAQPAVGSSVSKNRVFFGDSLGTLFVYQPVDPSDSDGGNACPFIVKAVVPGGQPIVAGPVVIPCTTGCTTSTDEIYLVASDTGSSNLVHFTYTASGLNYVPPSLPLPAPNASGIALSGSNSTFAISFLGGQVAVAHVNPDYTMSVSAPVSVTSRIADAPYWCQCQSGDVVAVGGTVVVNGVATNGGLYLFDAGLKPIGTYLSGSAAAIRTTPGTDKAGNWFVGADDGYVYEVKQGALTLSTTYGPMGGPISSSAVVGYCHSGLTVCIYIGLQNNQPTIVPLDNRQAALSACIIPSSSTLCTGASPRLSARLEVGSAVSAQTVRVRGWAYSSS